ncbi:hypothetical protein [Streptomyces sp. NPDC058457]|uniref:hypothetical protein n=1 Tax=Streptomyces sp. NPDC058457 TaxID=3346507 RepID=UPI003669E9B2
MNTLSSQPTAAVAWLSLIVAMSLSVVAALAAVIVKTRTGTPLSETVPIALACFVASMGVILASMSGVGLLRS